MNFFKGYILSRFVQWVIVIFVGVTVVFFVPRLSPMDPVQTTLSRLSSLSSVDPRAAEDLRKVLTELYGLQGSLLEQYISYWNRIIHFDLGPSLSMFPTPAIKVIKISLPWTIALMTISIIIGRLLGIILGTLVSYFSNNKWLQVLDKIIISIYPIPYYVMAMVLVFLFAYFIPIFPLVGGIGIGMKHSFSWSVIMSLVKHGFLPALSLILMNIGFAFISQKALTSNMISSDFVTYAESAAIPRRIILFQYILRNCLLPHLTDLSLLLGSIFSGAMITEFVFSYPGVGQLLYTAIMQGDFNMIMSITIFSVVGIATATLIADLLYPLLDPRIRYK